MGSVITLFWKFHFIRILTSNWSSNFFRKKAQDVLQHTNTFLKKEEELKKTQILANKTLEEAKKLQEIKEKILLENDKAMREKAVREKADEAMKKFEEDFQNLLKKYNTSKFEVLLDQLDSTTKEFTELLGGKTADIPKLEGDVNTYLECMDCYEEFLMKCQKNSVVSKQCAEKIEECKKI